MKRAGFDVRLANKTSRIDSIDFVKSMPLHITRDSVNLMGEIQTYIWDTDKDGNHIDEPVKLNDHALDAGRYATWTGLHTPTFTEDHVIGFY